MRLWREILSMRKCIIPEGKEDLFNSIPTEYSQLYLAIENVLEGVICIEDPLRPEAPEVIKALRNAGFSKIVMMTGDITISADNLYEIVTLKNISNLLIKRINKNYRTIVTFNSLLIALGIAGVLPPTTSAMLHNTSTLLISLSSMNNLLSEDSSKC